MYLFRRGYGKTSWPHAIISFCFYSLGWTDQPTLSFTSFPTSNFLVSQSTDRSDIGLDLPPQWPLSRKTIAMDNSRKPLLISGPLHSLTFLYLFVLFLLFYFTWTTLSWPTSATPCSDQHRQARGTRGKQAFCTTCSPAVLNHHLSLTFLIPSPLSLRLITVHLPLSSSWRLFLFLIWLDFMMMSSVHASSFSQKPNLPSWPQEACMHCNMTGTETMLMLVLIETTTQ